MYFIISEAILTGNIISHDFHNFYLIVYMHACAYAYFYHNIYIYHINKFILAYL